MLVKDAFKEVFTGFNMTNAVGNEKYVKDVYFIQKDSIQYTNIIEKKLIPKRISIDIKNKYIMKERDIIISLKKPYKVGTYECLPCKTEWIHHPDDVRSTKGGTMYTFPGRKVNTFIFNAEGFLYLDGKLREGMTDVLDYVKERGGRMLVISDKSKDETIADLQTLGIDTYFEEVLGRDMIENEKPATDMMDLVLEKYPQEDIHRYLILTHDINDVYVANTLGLRCIIVPVDGQVDEIMDDRSWKALEKIEDIIPYFDWRKLRVE